jgi:hypothetical protein
LDLSCVLLAGSPLMDLSPGSATTMVQRIGCVYCLRSKFMSLDGVSQSGTRRRACSTPTFVCMHASAQLIAGRRSQLARQELDVVQTVQHCPGFALSVGLSPPSELARPCLQIGEQRLASPTSQVRVPTETSDHAFPSVIAGAARTPRRC